MIVSLDGCRQSLLTYQMLSLNIIYSSTYVSNKGLVIGSATLLDDWLKRDRFVFIGWTGLLLFPTAYLSLGG